MIGVSFPQGMPEEVAEEAGLMLVPVVECLRQALQRTRQQGR